MIKTATVRARVEPRLKSRAERILKRHGLNSSRAITLFLHQICNVNGIPFEIKTPNEETKKAIEDAIHQRNITTFKNEKDLFADLGI